jgi:hypothetical protein
MRWSIVLVVVLVPNVRADWKSRAATEAAESLVERFGAKAGRSVPVLAQRIETLATRYGDDAIVAIRRGGPEAVSLVESAGVDGGKALRVLATHGEEGASRVLGRPTAMKQFLRYGDDAATALVKHPGVAEPLVERGGAEAVGALGAINPRNGRRLAMVLEDELANSGQQKEVLEVVAKYGDPAMEFIWNHKGSLAVGATLTAFVVAPEKFLNTAEGVTRTVADSVVKPIAEVPGEAVKGVAAGTNWTVVFCVAAALVCLMALGRHNLRNRV